MPTTARGIWTPSDDDNYDPVINLATMASTIDMLLDSGANMHSGTAAQRVAFIASAKEGAMWKDTDSNGLMWFKNQGEWSPLTDRCGIVSVPTGPLGQVGGMNIYATNVLFNVPAVAPAGYAFSISLTNIGSGYGSLGMLSTASTGSSTNIGARFVQIGAANQQTLSVMWTISRITN
jgi:hypothetical protein